MKYEVEVDITRVGDNEVSLVQQDSGVDLGLGAYCDGAVQPEPGESVQPGA